MSEIYSVEMFANGVKYMVFFFGSFSGHFHPWTPIHPLTIDETHKGLEKYSHAPYYQGWYSDSPKGPRLEKLIKYMMYRDSIKIDIELSNFPGVYYHRIEKIDGVWKIKESLSPELTLQQENYFRYVVNEEGKAEFSYRIYVTPMWSVEYKYKKSGAIDKVIKEGFDLPETIPE